MSDAYSYLDPYNNNNDFVLNAYRQKGAVRHQVNELNETLSSIQEFDDIDDIAWSDYVVLLNKRQESKETVY